MYYALIASLPFLPHFERAEHPPINPERLRLRRAMLMPDDEAQLARAIGLIAWHRQTLARTDEDVVRQFRAVIAQTTNRELRDLLLYRLGMRTVMAALRRRVRREELPPAGELWGVDPYARFIRARWEKPDFGLSGAFPWITEARGHLERADARSLDRVLMGSVWKRLDRIGGDHPFEFEEVFAYVFKWDILTRWLSYDPVVAQERFQKLIVEVIGEHQQLF